MSTDFNIVCHRHKKYWHGGQRMADRYSFGYARHDFVNHERVAQLIAEHLSCKPVITVTDDVPLGYEEIKYDDVSQPLIIEYANLLHEHQNPEAQPLKDFVQEHSSDHVFMRRVDAVNRVFRMTRTRDGLVMLANGIKNALEESK